MYRVSLVGIDNTGKTSIVRSLQDTENLGTINTFGDYRRSQSRLARISGSIPEWMSQFGDRHDQKSIAGLGYVMHFVPYFFEIRANKDNEIVVCDRDVIVDPLCYSESYLPEKLSKGLRRTLISTLESVFDPADLLIYLQASPEAAIQRNPAEAQIHETEGNLARVAEIYDGEIYRLESGGISVVRIDTNLKTLDEVTEEVIQNIEQKSGISLV